VAGIHPSGPRRPPVSRGRAFTAPPVAVTDVPTPRARRHSTTEPASVPRASAKATPAPTGSPRARRPATDHAAPSGVQPSTSTAAANLAASSAPARRPTRRGRAAPRVTGGRARRSRSARRRVRAAGCRPPRS
jgi:hypothetical protein